MQSEIKDSKHSIIKVLSYVKDQWGISGLKLLRPRKGVIKINRDSLPIVMEKELKNVVTEIFEEIMKNKAADCRLLYNFCGQADWFIDLSYFVFRQIVTDLIVELSQGANVDWDELNATMKDWH